MELRDDVVQELDAVPGRVQGSAKRNAVTWS
jgi:hypothetical protein